MIKIRKSKDGQYYFVVCSSNGKVLATSETYVSKRNAMRGVKAIVIAMRVDFREGTHLVDETKKK